MKSPGNFLILDDETTKLLQVLGKLHPHGSKRVLRIVLNFYVKLAKHARKNNTDPLGLLQDIAVKYLSGDLAAFELKKIKRLDSMMQEVEGSSDIVELKALIRDLRTTVHRRRDAPAQEDLSPKEAAKLVKLKRSSKPRSAQDYRKVRSKKRARKIDF